MFASGCASKRLGNTRLLLPTVGHPAPFKDLRAGDFFMDKGQLYLKTNIEDGVEIPNGNSSVIGVNKFTTSHIVYVVSVEISIK